MDDLKLSSFLVFGDVGLVGRGRVSGLVLSLVCGGGIGGLVSGSLVCGGGISGLVSGSQIKKQLTTIKNKRIHLCVCVCTINACYYTRRLITKVYSRMRFCSKLAIKKYMITDTVSLRALTNKEEHEELPLFIILLYVNRVDGLVT
jgi:hypothetical protein